MAMPRSLCFIFSITISEDSASYFLEMVIIVSLEGTLTETGIGVDRAIYLVRGS